MTESLTNYDNEAFDDEAACKISAAESGVASLMFLLSVLIGEKYNLHDWSTSSGLSPFSPAK